MTRSRITKSFSALRTPKAKVFATPARRFEMLCISPPSPFESSVHSEYTQFLIPIKTALEIGVTVFIVQSSNVF